MPKVEQIDIKAIFEKAAGRKIRPGDPLFPHVPVAVGVNRPPIAGNLDSK